MLLSHQDSVSMIETGPYIFSEFIRAKSLPKVHLSSLISWRIRHSVLSGGGTLRRVKRIPSIVRWSERVSNLTKYVHNYYLQHIRRC